MDDPGDDSEWPFEGTESSPPHRRGWPWVIGLILVVMLVCGAGVLALNAWVGRELDKSAANPRLSDGAAETCQDLIGEPGIEIDRCGWRRIYAGTATVYSRLR